MYLDPVLIAERRMFLPGTHYRAEMIKSWILNVPNDHIWIRGRPHSAEAELIQLKPTSFSWNAIVGHGWLVLKGGKVASSSHIRTPLGKCMLAESYAQ